ncbi:hypothetical protein [Nocardia sp. NRRL S-836]|uniref:hypothetical protein n=1 Tax=Nocardia sp. NRRL S-836 TaxID=1519492 RepID=UPI0006B01735|nr:hypothetical protein [Nocardia sp. NRRL S-836]KOV77640.1 hypothetical protein ADL03_41590 [Nocardia sp. NRRL S-836]
MYEETRTKLTRAEQTAREHKAKASKLDEIEAANKIDAEVVDDPDRQAGTEGTGAAADVIGEDETGVVATAELPDRIGRDSMTFGKALRRLSLPSPDVDAERIGGSEHPVSAQPVTAVVEHSGDT